MCQTKHIRLLIQNLGPLYTVENLGFKTAIDIVFILSNVVLSVPANKKELQVASNKMQVIFRILV